MSLDSGKGEVREVGYIKDGKEVSTNELDEPLGLTTAYILTVPPKDITAVRVSGEVTEAPDEDGKINVRTTKGPAGVQSVGVAIFPAVHQRLISSGSGSIDVRGTGEFNNVVSLE